MTSGIDLERDADVFVLRMAAGENRLNAPFLDAYEHALDEVEGSDGPAALVTTGEGKFYSNGLDLAWLGGDGAGEAEAFLDRLHRLFARLLAFPAYTVAAIGGHAFAAGGMLALAHDRRVMRADRGFFCLPEIDLRLPLQPGMTALIRARLPIATAHEAIVTGARYGGSDALAKGIVDEVASEAELLPRAIAIAAGMAPKRHETMRALKRGLYAETLRVLDPQPR